MKSDDNYESLSSGFVEVFNELNSLIRNQVLSIDGKEHTLQFFLGSDYKVKITQLTIDEINYLSIDSSFYLHTHVSGAQYTKLKGK